MVNLSDEYNTPARWSNNTNDFFLENAFDEMKFSPKNEAIDRKCPIQKKKNFKMKMCISGLSIFGIRNNSIELEYAFIFRILDIHYILYKMCCFSSMGVHRALNVQ